MNDQDYEYRGLIASAWDLLRGDTSDWSDRIIYRDTIAQNGEPALEIGCSTGRLLLEFLTQGLDVDGVDISPEMLELCRQKAQKLGLQPVLYQQAMESLELPRKYQTIFVPSSSFQLVTSLDGAREAMKRFFDHLQPGGKLVMSFMLLGQDESGNELADQDWRIIAEKTRPEDGAVVRRWWRATYDQANQLQHTEDRYEVILDGVVIESELHQQSPATRWYTQEQAVNLYQQVGFTNVHVVCGSTLEPASEDDKVFTIFGMRA
jgi:SAM-dependent methyltransferase